MVPAASCLGLRRAWQKCGATNRVGPCQARQFDNGTRICGAGRMATSVGASECRSIGGKRGTAESTGACNNNRAITQLDLLFIAATNIMRALAEALH